MPHQVFIARRHVAIFAIGIAATLGPFIYSACAGPTQEQSSSSQQQTSQSPQSSPKQPGAEAQPNSQLDQSELKKKKIWTNDDIVSLRTPTDNYLLQKEQQEAAAAHAAAEEATEKGLGKDDESTIKLRPTIEETQKQINIKEQQLTDKENEFERVINELPGTPEDQKPAMQREIERLAADVSQIRRDLKLLQHHLEQLAQEHGNETATPAVPPSL